MIMEGGERGETGQPHHPMTSHHLKQSCIRTSNTSKSSALHVALSESLSASFSRRMAASMASFVGGSAARRSSFFLDCNGRTRRRTACQYVSLEALHGKGNAE